MEANKYFTLLQITSNPFTMILWVPNNNTPLASAGQTGNVNITDITEAEILDAPKP
jgi:hypothetical protein